MKSGFMGETSQYISWQPKNRNPLFVWITRLAPFYEDTCDRHKGRSGGCLVQRKAFGVLIKISPRKNSPACVHVVWKMGAKKKKKRQKGKKQEFSLTITSSGGYILVPTGWYCEIPQLPPLSIKILRVNTVPQYWYRFTIFGLGANDVTFCVDTKIVFLLHLRKHVNVVTPSAEKNSASINYHLNLRKAIWLGWGIVLAVFKRESLKAMVCSQLGGSYCFQEAFMHVGLLVS